MDRLGDLPGVSGLRVIDDNTLHDENPPLLNESFLLLMHLRQNGPHRKGYHSLPEYQTICKEKEWDQRSLDIPIRFPYPFSAHMGLYKSITSGLSQSALTIMGGKE
jgi:hypothetical protein